MPAIEWSGWQSGHDGSMIRCTVGNVSINAWAGGALGVDDSLTGLTIGLRALNNASLPKLKVPKLKVYANECTNGTLSFYSTEQAAFHAAWFYAAYRGQSLFRRIAIPFVEENEG